ncbi:MAG: calcium-binding EGF-like domain-containing protein, partial [Myxococcota bacterium]|nr:calcium-binding EGF-like domain-containing protein [Myxococcota bacterium]
EEDTTPDEDVAPSGPIDCSDGTPCPANSFCGEDSGVCECKEGFEPQFGGLQCTDIDECESGTAECQENSTCKNLFGSYTCNCDDGYYNAGIGVCADFDECELDGSCPKAATCTNTDGGFECACPNGTVLSDDASTCDDLNECADFPCAQGEQCINTEAGYICVPEGTCIPQCSGAQCGADGCGGSCGNCSGNTSCEDGLCIPNSPVSGTCDGAPILSIPGSLSGTTTGQSNSFSFATKSESCTGYTTKGSDVAYTLSGAPGETFDVVLTPDFEGALYVVTDCDDISASCLAGSDGSSSSGGSESVTVTMPSTGVAYAFVDSFWDTGLDWDGSSKGFGSFTLTAGPAGSPCTPDCAGKVCGADGCGGTCGSCSEGGECNNGQCSTEPSEFGGTCDTATLSFVPFTLQGTTEGASSDFELDFGECAGYTTLGPDVVHSMFASSSTTYKITLDSDFYSTVYVLSDCETPNASCLVGTESFTATSKEVLFTPPATGTYYLIVDSYTPLSTGDFTLTVTEDTSCTPSCGSNECGEDGCGGSCGTCTGGASCIGGSCVGGATGGQWDTCDSAKIEFDEFSVSGTTVGNTNEYDSEDCTSLSMPGPDAVIKAYLTKDQEYLFTLTSENDAAIYIVSDCSDIGGTCLDGHDSEGFGDTETFNFTPTTSSAVYIIIDTFSSTSNGGTFTLDVTEV